ncbi:hypothetical protein GCM10011316_23050 [Roseibium aquae]|uniref:DUF2267 domain-containing protein n=1 Tax=Roseibium aquae TaxID=1323746 RepID=A0A916X2H1_9HYPH|nr:DUF2267 domain-containing protein [Roseibium aquae]GGB50318.1 hypothetical protein GCM10011316_23050 [Roseibium aquae]
MQDLIDRIAQAADISAETSRKAIGIILGFLEKAGPEDKVAEVFAALPGARELVDEKAAEKSGGMLSGLGNMMGGMGAAMAALNELTSAGLSMDEIKSVTQELVAYAKEKAGEETVDEVISKIPGLNQIV